MNKYERPLDQLFEAARGTPQSPVGPVPGYLKTRILGHWRTGARANGTSSSLVVVFRGALICAGVVMALSLVWGYGGLFHQPESDLAIANYETWTCLMP